MPDDREPIVGPWRGVTNYQCRMCAFSTLDKRKFEQHIILRHPPLEIIDGGVTAGEESSDGEAGSDGDDRSRRVQRRKRRGDDDGGGHDE